jgi:hypothetical protein
LRSTAPRPRPTRAIMARYSALPATALATPGWLSDTDRYCRARIDWPAVNAANAASWQGFLVSEKNGIGGRAIKVPGLGAPTAENGGPACAPGIAVRLECWSNRRRGGLSPAASTAGRGCSGRCLLWSGVRDGDGIKCLWRGGPGRRGPGCAASWCAGGRQRRTVTHHPAERRCPARR